MHQTTGWKIDPIQQDIPWLGTIHKLYKVILHKSHISISIELQLQLDSVQWSDVISNFNGQFLCQMIQMVVLWFSYYVPEMDQMKMNNMIQLA